MPYIEHPEHVAAAVEGDEAKAVAWLHDVVEDTSYSFSDLEAQGISPSVTDALRLLTHDKAVPYLDYVRAIKQSPLATKVKLADLTHNSDLGRLARVTEEDRARVEKYRRAIQMLSE